MCAKGEVVEGSGLLGQSDKVEVHICVRGVAESECGGW